MNGLVLDGDEKTHPSFATNTLEGSNAESAKVIYVGNKNTKKYHTENCTYAKKAKESDNEVIFNSKEEAEKEGYEACKVCNP